MPLLLLPFFAYGQSLRHDLDSLLQNTFSPDQPGGALLVVKNDRVIFKKAIGLADLEKRVPLTPKSNFRMASVSKQFTAMAVLLLEKQANSPSTTRSPGSSQLLRRWEKQ